MGVRARRHLEESQLENHRDMSFSRWLALSLLMLMPGCALFGPQEDRFGAREITFADLPGWGADDYAEAVTVFLSTCSTLTQKSQEQTAGSRLQISEASWRALCNDASLTRHDPMRAKAFFETHFTPFRIINRGR